MSRYWRTALIGLLCLAVGFVIGQQWPRHSAGKGQTELNQIDLRSPMEKISTMPGPGKRIYVIRDDSTGNIVYVSEDGKFFVVPAK